MEELLDLLHEIAPNVDFENETNLVEDGLIDSFAIIRIVSAVAEEFDVELTVKDIIPENFASAEKIYSVIQSLQD